VRPVAAGARLAPGARYGTVHVVAGGGGAGLYPVAPQPYAACKKSVHHFVVLDFDGAAIQGQALDLDGNVIDRFALRRGQPQPADEYCAYEPMLWGHVAETAAPQLQAGPQGEVAGEGTIVARSPFPMRVAGELAWQAPPGWEIAGEPQRFSAEPGGELKLQFRVKGTWAKDRPLPTVTVRLTEADGGFDFVNREFTVRPFSVKAP
jgi:hypothetical protein